MNVEKIKQLRKEKGWTRYHLSQVSGVPDTTLRNIEKGYTKSSKVSTLQAIAKALDVDITKII